MTSDLFITKSKKDQLLDWIKRRGRARTSEVILWGTSNYCNRADRNARQLAEEGKIFRMADFYKTACYGNTREDAYTIYENEAVKNG